MKLVFYKPRNEDTLFSRYIKKRDKVCQVCGKQGTDCSHFHRRGVQTTRYDERNSVLLCREHHNWFHEARRAYEVFMIARLGVTVFDELERLANKTLKDFGMSKEDVLKLVRKHSHIELNTNL